MLMLISNKSSLQHIHTVYAEIFNISMMHLPTNHPYRFKLYSMFFFNICSMEEEQDSNLCIETDSDTADKKDGTKCKIKWTQEEVSEKRTFNTFMLIF